jgi:hypothetical protein
MDDRRDALTADQAARLWSRAAELQDRARMEAERLAAESASGAGDPQAISPDIAREAAVESGIDGRYVDQALRQVSVDRELDTRASATRWARALRANDGTLSERIHLDASPDAVHAAAASVAQSAPFSLELLDVLQPDRSAAACLYEVPEDDQKNGTFRYRVRSVSDVRRVAIIVSPSPDGGADLEVYSRLDNSLLVNGIALRALQGVGAALGAGVGFALGALAARIAGLDAATVGSVLRGAVGVLTGLGAGALTGGAFRALYRLGLTRVRESFRKLLVAVRMQTDTDNRRLDAPTRTRPPPPPGSLSPNLSPRPRR